MNAADRYARLASRYQADGMAASSPQKLVVLIYNRISRDLDTAVTAIEARNVEGAHKALVNAQDLVFELQMALDTDAWAGARELDEIYAYLLSLLVEANTRKSVDVVRRCMEIVTPLRETWTEAYQMIQRGEATVPVSTASWPTMLMRISALGMASLSIRSTEVMFWLTKTAADQITLPLAAVAKMVVAPKSLPNRWIWRGLLT